MSGANDVNVMHVNPDCNPLIDRPLPWYSGETRITLKANNVIDKKLKMWAITIWKKVYLFYKPKHIDENTGTAFIRRI